MVRHPFPPPHPLLSSSLQRTLRFFSRRGPWHIPGGSSSFPFPGAGESSPAGRHPTPTPAPSPAPSPATPAGAGARGRRLLEGILSSPGNWWRRRSPRQRRWLRWLALVQLLAALAGASPVTLALLPPAIPLALAGAALDPYARCDAPLSRGLRSWHRALDAGGDPYLPLLLWFPSGVARGELAGLGELSDGGRALALLGGLLARLGELAAAALDGEVPEKYIFRRPASLLSGVSRALATFLPSLLATLLPAAPATPTGALAGGLLALLLRWWALQAEMANNLFYLLLPWLFTGLLSLPAALVQLRRILPRLRRDHPFTLWGEMPRSLVEALPALDFWSRNFGSLAELAGGWNREYFIPFFTAAEGWLRGPLLHFLDGSGSLAETLAHWGSRPPAAAALRGLEELALLLLGPEPPPPPLAGLFLAVTLASVALGLLSAPLRAVTGRRDPLPGPRRRRCHNPPSPFFGNGTKDLRLPFPRP